MNASLAGLDAIDWGGLVHAYGPANDVPGDLRALLSADDKIAKDALWRLFGNIVHQGSVYTATAPAVPFLTEIALALPPERAAGVVDLFSAMIKYSADTILHDQVTVGAFRVAIRAEEDGLDPDSMAECVTLGCPPTVLINTYDAVTAQIPLLMEGLDRRHVDVAVALLQLLADAPEHNETARALAQEALLEGKADEVVQVGAIECLLRLGRFVEVPGFGSIFEKLSAGDASPFLTAYVTLAQIEVGQADAATLVTVLEKADQLYEIDRKLSRGRGWTASRIAAALVPFAETDKERICDALLGAIAAARAHGATPDPVIAALVAVLASPHPARGYFSGKTPSDLTPLEKRALLHLVTFGSWKVSGKWFGNFANQMRSYGLPDKPDALAKYARGTHGLFARFFGR